MRSTVSSVESKKKNRFRFLRAFTFVVLLYSVGMDAVIDSIDIWNGNYTIVGRDAIQLKSARHTIRGHEGLFTGSYFEVQTKGEFHDKSLPSFGFEFFSPKSFLYHRERRDSLLLFPMLRSALLSLPPPQFEST
ncbi:hypothetical protein EHO61_16300 [Leptospira fluminis]|uniref:Uncharacterized protein n=1 Tax=Leptospira fluminis TaxID=2484979 RepID=A0A4R9GM41_9LEPT|nr:hypothetical protein [Leptospira fluminis]TGK15242.1 hypothetical protein EHO61_16300 [Leptospira fluminis]